jgi:hypothetical protein
LEDRLAALWCDVQEVRRGRAREGTLAALEQLDEDLEDSELSFEEWEVLYRKRLLVECALLRRADRGCSAAAPLGERRPRKPSTRL